MNAARWQQIKTAFDDVLQLEPSLRFAYIKELGTTDPDLRQRLAFLLVEHEKENDEFMRNPAADLTIFSDLIEIGDDSCVGTQIGPYKLLHEIGSGGMGEVYLAKRDDDEFDQRVAIKLIRSGHDSAAVVSRFKAERQILAGLDHPNIAKLLDGGRTTQGQPYFVMEYVPGLPITVYCDQKMLNIPERVELLIQVCDGVQHAHQNAIIHRDLKPSNILVVEVDGKAVPRIIDFGLAKTTASTSVDQTQLTKYGVFMGTPGYMSPEQADFGVRNVDTRTDVYSLGAMLYVLLTGLHPFETVGQRLPPFDEWLRRLREEEPPRPSTNLKAKHAILGTTIPGAAELTLVPADLDWITMKALERDRTRRYSTPAELAADLRRYLDHDPVVARPASAGYRLRKYTRRHRVAVGVGAGLLVTLSVLALMQAVHLQQITQERDRANQELARANQERDRANQERDRATRITDFMTGMFNVSDPSEARGNSVTAREILDKASKDTRTGLAKDPEALSQMMQVMASTYLSLGLQSHAHELAQQALDLRLSLHGPDDPKTLESMAQLGLILHHEGEDLEAQALERRALADERRVLGAEDPLTLQTMDHLAVILRPLGHFGEAEKLAREVVEVASRTLGPESQLTLQSMGHLGSALFYQGRYAEAEHVLRKALDIERRIWGPDHPEALRALTVLAIAIHHQGRLAEAEPMYREILGTSERVLGSEHRSTAVAMGNLADLLIDEGHLAEGEKLEREALGILTRALGPEHTSTLMIQLNLALVLFKEGNVRDAERLQRETLAAEIRVHGPENPDTLSTQTDLAETLLREDRYPEAEALARETFNIQRRTLGSQHPATLETLQQLGVAMAYDHHYAEASKLFRDVIETGNNSTTQGNRWSAWYRFACMAAAAKHPDDALQYLQEAIDRGYQDADRLMDDENLKNLRGNASFQGLVAELKRLPSPMNKK